MSAQVFVLRSGYGWPGSPVGPRGESAALYLSFSSLMIEGVTFPASMLGSLFPTSWAFSLALPLGLCTCIPSSGVVFPVTAGAPGGQGGGFPCLHVPGGCSTGHSYRV